MPPAPLEEADSEPEATPSERRQDEPPAKVLQFGPHREASATRPEAEAGGNVDIGWPRTLNAAEPKDAPEAQPDRLEFGDGEGDGADRER